MTSGWIAVLISALVAVAAFLRMIWLDGRRNGNLEAILRELSKGLVDHEERLRSIELGRPGAAARRRGH